MKAEEEQGLSRRELWCAACGVAMVAAGFNGVSVEFRWVVVVSFFFLRVHAREDAILERERERKNNNK